jgi:hypothetical protein
MLRRVIRTVIAVAISALMLSLSLGLASAKSDPLIGKTFAEASARIADWGSEAVVSTVFGSQLATDECIVTGWHRSSYAKRDNFDHKKSVAVSLNCTNKLASAGSPGNSLASEAGRAEKKIEVQAERFNSKPQRCSSNLSWCKSFCDKNAGMCSKEVMALVA